MQRIKDLTIITITRDDYHGLKKTLESVEKFKEIFDADYVVVDASSIGEFAKMHQRFSQTIDVLLEGPDTGIYNGMNRGLAHVTSRYVLFLNSGDVLAANSSVWVNEIRKNPQCDLFFSDICVNDGSDVININYSWHFCFHNAMNHQNMIISTKLLDCGYDERFKICADVKWQIENLSKISKFKLSTPISIFDLGGISGGMSRSRRISIWRERYMAFIRATNISPGVRFVGCVVSIIILIIKVFLPNIGSRSNVSSKEF